MTGNVSSLSKQVREGSFSDSSTIAPTIGIVISLDEHGHVFVDFRHNPAGPLQALLAVDERALTRADFEPGRTRVLLVFEDNDLERPIIVGLVRDAIPVTGGQRESLGPGQGRAVIEGEEITIKADRELALSCGDSTIVLRKNGTLVLRGKELTSRAKGTNRIRGASVRIN